jgi:hypothetical protein
MSIPGFIGIMTAVLSSELPLENLEEASGKVV